MTAADITGLADLKNLGAKSALWLVEAGVETPEQLAEIGAVEAYARVKAMRPRVSIVMLWALHGALEDIHFAQVSPEVKDVLKSVLEERNAANLFHRHAGLDPASAFLQSPQVRQTPDQVRGDGGLG